LAFSYSGKNKINSKFWHGLRSKSISLLQNSKNWQAWLTTVEQQNKILGYAPADASMMRTYIHGFDIDLTETKQKPAT